MAKTPVRRLIEQGIEAGADYIPDVIETPLRRAFSIDVPKTKARKPKASLAVTPKAKPKQLALPAQVHANGRFNERSHGTLFDLIIVSIIVRATI